MKLYAPDYYNDFHCIADKCRHSCCVGWEIDIDEETLEYYKSVRGELGKRLESNIAYEEDIAHFVLDKNERCPFLNDSNLCDIITELDEDALCRICADHPRFRNFFSDRIEIGLGLCCEAAAEIIMTRSDKTKIIELENDGKNILNEEQSFFEFRDRLFEILQNRAIPIDERVKIMLDEYDVALPEKSVSEWGDFCLKLERLDPAWTDMLGYLKKADVPQRDFLAPEWQNAFEQLLIYFLYRHLPDGLYDGGLRGRIAFAVVSYYIVRALCAARGADITGLIEIARMYSSEIEYAEENINAMLDEMQT